MDRIISVDREDVIRVTIRPSVVDVSVSSNWKRCRVSFDADDDDDDDDADIVLEVCKSPLQ